NACYQPDIGKLGLIVHEDDIRRLNVPVHESMSMKMPERAGKLHTQRYGIGYRQPSPRFKFRSESAGTVRMWNRWRLRIGSANRLRCRVTSHPHHKKEPPRRIVASGVKHIHDAGV